MSTGRGRGFTMIELVIAIVIASIVLGASFKLLTSNQRFYRSQSQLMDVQQNLRTITAVLASDLRELDARGGDIVLMTDTAISIRGMRGWGIVCTTPVVGTGQFVIKNSLFFMAGGTIDVTKDNILLFREANTTSNTDDKWLVGSISATGSSNCTDGTAGTRLTVSVTGGNSQLDSVTVGAPLRIWEQVNYRLYLGYQNAYWLGTRTLVNGSYASNSPVAGPLASTRGLQLIYYDSTGAVTATATNVASIGVIARGQSLQDVQFQGRPSGPYRDSVLARVALRNN
jgi:prepilin-type N-terminal cleavage/methylation domain-containing protein